MLLREGRGGIFPALSCLKVMLCDASEQCGWHSKELSLSHGISSRGRGLAHFSLCSPSCGCVLGMKVKASDPGRNSEWGRFRDKTNFRVAQGPPAVTSPRLGVRGATGSRRKGRGRVGPRGPGLRQPATKKRGVRVGKPARSRCGSQGLGDEGSEVGKDGQGDCCTVF